MDPRLMAGCAADRDVRMHLGRVIGARLRHPRQIGWRIPRPARTHIDWLMVDWFDWFESFVSRFCPLI